jgi:omega-6 fatty acid desaturase (delta-12 desaturase)
LSATVGTFLFFVQHQFEDTYWANEAEWDYTLAALRGSSYYKLPKVLQWFTGNIGFHHIHHLSPRIPNYYLEKCHEENQLFQQVVVLTLGNSFKCLFLSLWDEDQGQLVGFGQLKSRRLPVTEEMVHGQTTDLSR